MLTFIKKDLLVFWRDRRETLLAIILPIVLVVVLNFAFSNLFGTDAKPISLTLAIVDEDNEAAGMKLFEEKVLTMELPVEETEAILTQASQLDPGSLLQHYFRSPELSEWVTVHPLSESEALQQVEKSEIDGYIHLTPDYTYRVLNAAVLGEEASGVHLPFKVKEYSMNVGIVSDMISEFFNQINFQLAMQHAAGDAIMPEEPPAIKGGREALAGAEPFTMGQYFTIAMAALFALFLSASVAEKTAAEKRERVFNRIMITNTRPLVYLMGKVSATFCLVWLQFSFIVLDSHFMMGVFAGKSPKFWFGLLLVMTFYAITMAGLSALYTSIMLKLHSIDTANGIFMLITMVLGIIGGNFVPIYVLPDWLQRIGEWSPNGFTLAVLTEWIQFEQFAALWTLILALGIISAACLLAGIVLYPKRGEV